MGVIIASSSSSPCFQGKDCIALLVGSVGSSRWCLTPRSSPDAASDPSPREGAELIGGVRAVVLSTVLFSLTDEQTTWPPRDTLHVTKKR